MREDYEVGRIAVDTSRRALINIGLTEEYEMESHGGANLKVLGITTFGKSVAEKISEIADLMNKK